MAIENLFDLTREHIFSADDQHLLDASRDREHAVFIKPPHIASLEKSVLVKDSRSFLRQVEISLHHVWSAHANLAVFIWPKHAAVGRDNALLDSWQRLAHALASLLGGSTPIGHGSGFGEPVALIDFDSKLLKKAI